MDLGEDVDMELDFIDLDFQAEKGLTYIEENQEEEEEEDCEELKLPRFCRWMDSLTSKNVEGLQFLALKYEARVRPDDVVPFESCPICLHPFNVNHRLCCLPCGHMFGYTCIERWIGVAPSNSDSAVCPECRTSYTLGDITILFETCLSVSATSPAADQTVLNQNTPTRHFAYSLAGVQAYKAYELGRILYTSKKRVNVLKQRAKVLELKYFAMQWKTRFMKRHAVAVKKCNESLGQRVDAWRSLADKYAELADKYLHKEVAFGQQADAYRRRAEALRQRHEKFVASIEFFEECYKEYHGLV